MFSKQSGTLQDKWRRGSCGVLVFGTMAMILAVW